MKRSVIAITAWVVMSTGLCAAGQNSNPKQPPAPSPSGADAEEPSPPKGAAQSPPAANKFPYPGETTPAASAEKTQPAGAGAPPAGSAAGKSFPYPGDADAGESGSSSSSSGSAAPSGDGDIPADAGAPHRRKLPREFHPQSPEDRVTEDLEVARFYRDKGDLHAAYLRAQDATKVMPNDPEAHFLLGQIAQGMKHHDEAVAEFKSYLQLEPDGDHVKEARRRLAEMR